MCINDCVVLAINQSECILSAPIVNFSFWPFMVGKILWLFINYTCYGCFFHNKIIFLILNQHTVTYRCLFTRLDLLLLHIPTHKLNSWLQSTFIWSEGDVAKLKKTNEPIWHWNKNNVVNTIINLYLYFSSFSPGQKEVCHTLLPASEYRGAHLSRMEVENNVLTGWRGGEAERTKRGGRRDFVLQQEQ